jgi:hypothetical protein
MSSHACGYAIQIVTRIARATHLLFLLRSMFSSCRPVRQPKNPQVRALMLVYPAYLCHRGHDGASASHLGFAELQSAVDICPSFKTASPCQPGPSQFRISRNFLGDYVVASAASVRGGGRRSILRLRRYHPLPAARPSATRNRSPKPPGRTCAVCRKVCRTLRADMRQYGLFRYFFRALPCGLGCGQVIDLLAPIRKTRTPS